jgi:ubiquinone/menaquinone biosynthesis C-methylase UbiE
MSQPYFAQIADQWDSLRLSMFSDEVRKIALDHAGLHPESIVIDLGGGTGFLSEGLAPRVALVHLVESSPEMLTVARQKLVGFPNVQYHLADGLAVPLPDECVDAVLANMYLHHMAEPGLALSEVYRLLRPGGRLVITDLNEHTHTWLRQEHADVWLGFSHQQVYDWMAQAGLVNLLVENTSQSCSSTSQTQDNQASVNIFVAVGTKPIRGMQQAVADHYRQIANAATSCCGPAEASLSLPSSEGSIPLDVIQPPAAICCGPEITPSTDAEISLGCGNPVALASLQPGEVVLDIGSGAGADLFPAAQRVGSTGKVIGVDMLEEMLVRARRTAGQHGYTNVEFRQGDASRLPLEDGSVDVVMSNCVINLVPDKGQVFREAYRVLKPGGRLAISDVVTDRAFSPAIRLDPETWSACVTGALPESEYLALISQAGFKQLSVKRSPSWPAPDGTQVYSLNVSAQKES